MQVLQGMPVLAAPVRAAEVAPGPAFLGDTPILNVPAAPELLPLQPSKLAVYKLFVEQVFYRYTSHCIPLPLCL